MSQQNPRTILISRLGGRIVSKSPDFAFQPHISPSITEDYIENGVKKRRRLTHLTPEERMMRRYVFLTICAWLLYYWRIVDHVLVHMNTHNHVANAQNMKNTKSPSYLSMCEPEAISLESMVPVSSLRLTPWIIIIEKKRMYSTVNTSRCKFCVMPFDLYHSSHCTFF